MTKKNYELGIMNYDRLCGANYELRITNYDRQCGVRSTKNVGAILVVALMLMRQFVNCLERLDA